MNKNFKKKLSFQDYMNWNFIISSSANFISIFGSKLLLMAYIAHVFDLQKSTVLISLIFAMEWSTSLIVAFFGTHLIDRGRAKNILVILNVLSAVVTFSFMYYTEIKDIVTALGIIGLRAYLSHLIYAARTKSFFQFFTEDERDAFTPIFNSTQIIAMALAGACGAMIINKFDFKYVVIIDCITFLVAAFLFFITKPLSNIEATVDSKDNNQSSPFFHIAATFKEIKSHYFLSNGVFYIILIASVFQGTFSVLFASLPQDLFNMDKSGTAYYFMGSSISIALGSFLYQYLNRRKKIGVSYKKETMTLVFLAAISYLLLAFVTHNWQSNLLVFLVMVFLFEMAWLHQFTQIIKYSCAKMAARISSFQMGIGYVFMAIWSATFSFIVDNFNLQLGMFVNLLSLIILTIFWEVKNYRKANL